MIIPLLISQQIFHFCGARKLLTTHDYLASLKAINRLCLPLHYELSQWSMYYGLTDLGDVVISLINVCGVPRNKVTGCSVAFICSYYT